MTLPSTPPPPPSPPPTSPAPTAPTRRLATFTFLPTEVVLRIFSHIDSPLDLYAASLTSRNNRYIGIDPRIWERHYWTFYHAPSTPKNDQDRLLLARRTANRHRAMRAWMDLATKPTPDGPLGPLLTVTGQEIRVYYPLCYGMQEFTNTKLMNSLPNAEQRTALRRRFHDLIEEHGGEEGPDDPLPATDRIVSTLLKEFGKPPVVDEEGVNAEWKEFVEKMMKPPREREPSYPPFLILEPKETTLPDFYGFFVKRIHADESLLRDLRDHLELDCKVLDSLLSIVERHGEGAQDFLAALCADQKISPQNVKQFASRAGEGSKLALPWPRAIDVHVRAAAGLSQPHHEHCMSLHAAAKHLLSHLQRRDAILSLSKLRNPPAHFPSFKEKVQQCSLAAEQALIDISLFRSGNRSELQEYLDLIALWVWADMDDRSHFCSDFFLLSPEADAKKKRERESKSDFKTPPGSTRLLVTKIERSLRRLGFCISTTTGQDEVDRNEFFLNVTMYCQSFHATSPRMYAALLCFVARRLGVAMTLLDARNQVTTIVVEQGTKPDDWTQEDGRTWSRFYYTPITGVDGRGRVIEAGEATEALAKTEQTPNAEPGLPLDMLAAFAEDLKGKFGSTLTWGTDEGEEDVSPFVAGLRHYLQGRRTPSSATTTTMPPFPLLPAIKPSSLTHLPNPTRNAPRGPDPGLRQLASYCSAWLLNFAHPNSARGAAGWHLVHQEVYQAITDEFPRHLDLATLLEVHGATDLGAELKHIRQSPQGNDLLAAMFGGLLNPDFGAAGRAPEPVRQYIALALSNDSTPNTDGLGGHGAGVEVVDPSRSDKELLSHDHPLNRRVKHAVGTCFVHKTFGYRGVVIGWDSRGTEERGRTCKMDFSTLRADGIDQPFYHVYHEDGTCRYVAQCDVEVARIPSGASQEAAAEILKEYTTLFNLWRVQRCFRTLVVNGWEEEGGAGKGEGTSGGVGGGGKGVGDKEEGTSALPAGGGKAKKKKKKTKKGKAKAGDQGDARGAAERSWESPGAIRLLMTPWMRAAWPDA